MNWKILRVTAIVALAATFALACGDDNDEPGLPDALPDNGDEFDDIELPNGGLFEDGTATLTIGNETWVFDGVFCAFSPEEADEPANSFFATGFGQSADGTRVQFDASIIDLDEEGRLEGPGVSHSVSLVDIDDPVNPSVSWSALGGIVNDDYIIQIDGNNVFADAMFEDFTTDDFERTPGTLEATCP